MAVSSNEKIAKLGQKGHVGSSDPILEFRDPPNISRTVEATNFEFGRNRTSVSSNEKNAKLGQNMLCYTGQTP